jgi:hypothetical protein
VCAHPSNERARERESERDEAAVKLASACPLKEGPSKPGAREREVERRNMLKARARDFEGASVARRWAPRVFRKNAPYFFRGFQERVPGARGPQLPSTINCGAVGRRRRRRRHRRWRPSRRERRDGEGGRGNEALGVEEEEDAEEWR